MMKYRHKPHKVEAVLFTGNNIDEVVDFLKNQCHVHATKSWFANTVVFETRTNDCYTGTPNIAFPNQFIVRDGCLVFATDKEEFLSKYERVQ